MTHDIAVVFRVKVAYRKLLHARKHTRTHFVKEALCYTCQNLRLHRGAYKGDCIKRDHYDESIYNFALYAAEARSKTFLNISRNGLYIYRG